MCISIILLFVCSTAVAQRSDKSLLYSRASISNLIVSLALAYIGTHLYFLDKGLSMFNGLVHYTSVSSTFHWFIILISCIILQLTSFYPRKLWSERVSVGSGMSKAKAFTTMIINKFSEQYKILEYSLIVLFVIMGGTFLMASSDLICIFLSIELQSYGLYILCTSYRNSERSTSGGLTYFLLGALSSCFILLGSGLLYGNSGNTLFDGIFIISNITNYLDGLNHGTWYLSTYLIFSLIVFSVGFLFKISAAPFHFWSPDVYDAIPTIVTTFVAVFAKISILVLFLELIHHTTNLSAVFLEDVNLIKDNITDTINNVIDYNGNSADKLQGWIFIFIISSFLSLTIGSLLGLTQFRIKRLYAYSTISHLGFILLALSINSLESIQSFIFYLTQYSLANLNAFFILIAIGYSLSIYIKKSKVIKQDNLEINNNLENQENNLVTPKLNLNLDKPEVADERERNNSPVQLVNDIKGYFFINPTLAISLTITLFSFVGIPPLVGFFAKQMVLSAALDNGYIFITLVAILTSVVSAYYYLAVVKQIFFFNSDYIINPQLQYISLISENRNKQNNVSKHDTKDTNVYFTSENVSLSSFLSITISVLTLIMLLFILTPQEWLSLGSILSIIIFNN